MSNKRTSNKAKVLTAIQGNLDLSRLLSVKQAAQFIGHSTSFLYKRKEIANIKVGKYIYFDPDELQRWLNQNAMRQASEKEVDEWALMQSLNHGC